MLKFRSNLVNGIEVENYILNKLSSLSGNFELRYISLSEVTSAFADVLSEVLVDSSELCFKLEYDTFTRSIQLIGQNEFTNELFNYLKQYQSAVEQGSKP